MNFFMGLSGAFGICVIVLIKMLFEQAYKIDMLRAANMELQNRNAELQGLMELSPDDRDIVFDGQGGFKIVKKNESKTV